jgi:hypothetical protein
MNQVYCFNLLTGQEFTLTFNNLKQQRLFLLRCKFSKKIKVLGYTYQNESQYRYLEYGD